MAASKRIRDLRETLDIDLQLMATELDTSANSLKYLSGELFEDAIAVERFNRLVNDIENEEGVEITAFNDNTILYEYLEEAVVVHSFLSQKYVIFDVAVTQKIEGKMNSYN